MHVDLVIKFVSSAGRREILRFSMLESSRDGELQTCARNRSREYKLLYRTLNDSVGQPSVRVRGLNETLAEP